MGEMLGFFASEQAVQKPRPPWKHHLLSPTLQAFPWRLNRHGPRLGRLRPTGLQPASSATESTETLARIPGHAGLELAAQGGVVEALADQHQLVLAGATPVAVVEREALAG